VTDGGVRSDKVAALIEEATAQTLDCSCRRCTLTSRLVAALQDTGAATGKTADDGVANELYLNLADALCLALNGHPGKRGQCHDVLRAVWPLIADALAVLGQDQAANESAVLLRAARHFEEAAGNYYPHLGREGSRAQSDANIRAAVHLRHLARVGFNPCAAGTVGGAR